MHKLRSATFMTFITGSIAESEKVIAGMPPRFLGTSRDVTRVVGGSFVKMGPQNHMFH